MLGTHLLPGEAAGPRAIASVDEAGDPPASTSVRALRERFEQTRRESAALPRQQNKQKQQQRQPQKQRKATAKKNSTQADLAAFLKNGNANANPPASNAKPEHAAAGPEPRLPPSSAAEQKSLNSVSSLIEQFSEVLPVKETSAAGASTSQTPAPGGPAHLANREPLSAQELHRMALHSPTAKNKAGKERDDPDTFCDSWHGMDDRQPKTVPGHFDSVARLQVGSPRSDRQGQKASDAPVSAPADHNLLELVSAQAKESAPTYDRMVDGTSRRTHAAAESDWGAAQVHLQELFAEAETTAEKAVQCDENEEYYDAFSLYCNVVSLYYKVIPFLNAEEGEDVNQRIKMYTRRCEAIREAFESEDREGDDETPEDDHQDTHGNAQPQSVGPFDPFYGKGTMTQNEQSVLDAEHFGGIPSQPKGYQTGRDLANLARPLQGDRDVDRGPGVSYVHHGGLLPPNSSAVAAAHRNRLSRPISRRSIREAASTNSVSREKVAEMQERVQVMQSCLNNFTVKRKHLGPARALELQITTLNANTFGDLKRLEPLPPKLEHMWATELEVLLSMLQEIKVSHVGKPNALRDDIARHLPALQRCDRIVRNTLRSFSELVIHVQYIDRETVDDPAKGGTRNQRRWWIKVPVVAKGGLPGNVRDLVEEAGEELKGVFKVCHEINIDVVKSMPVPASFVEALPKHARLLIPKDLKEGLTTWGMFKVSDFMKDRGMWNRESAKDICSNLEKVALIWEARTSNQSFLSRTFDIRGERFHQAITAFRRCQNAIRDLRREWPTMTHTDLDMAKIQSNEDIGLAGLEAYSRALESRAARLLTRIKELVDADEEARGRPLYNKKKDRAP